MQPGDNAWIEAWTQVALFMGPFVLPILVGIYAAFVCRGEHVGGGDGNSFWLYQSNTQRSFWVNFLQ